MVGAAEQKQLKKLHTVTENEEKLEALQQELRKVMVRLQLTIGLVFMLVLGVAAGGAYALQRSTMRHIKGMENSISVLAGSIEAQTSVDLVFFKILALRPRTEISFAKSIARHISHYSSLYGIDPDLVLAVIDIESAFRPKARSRAGAEGLMQLMSNWVAVFNIVGDLTDPEINIKYGTQVLRLYYELYQGNIEQTLAAYNRGPSSVDWALIKDREVDKHGYVTKVMRRYEYLKKLRG